MEYLFNFIYNYSKTMNAKQERQAAIRRLVETGHYHTQREIIEALTQNGIHVNQGTLSKDFKALNILKIRTADGRFKYVIPRYYSSETQDELVEREVRDFVAGVDIAVNMVVLKTSAGHASGVCETIDRVAWPEVVGSIAGENTILLIARSAQQAKKLIKRIEKIMEDKRDRL